MAGRAKIAGYFWVKISIAFGFVLGLLLLVQTVGTYNYVSRSLVRQQARAEADQKVQSLGRLTRFSGSRESSTLKAAIDEFVKEEPARIAWMRVLGTEGNVIASGGNLAGAPHWTPELLRGAVGPRQNQYDVRTTASGDVLLVVSPLRMGGPGRNGAGPPPGGAGRGGGVPQDGFNAGRGPRPDDAASLPVGVPAAVAQAEVAQAEAPRAPRAGAQGGSGRGPGRGLTGPYLETAVYLKGISVDFSNLMMPLGVGCSAALALLAAVILIGLRFPHYIAGKQYEEEMALARRVQRDLFPREGVPTGNVEFAARFIPSRQVGGDLYDVFETADGGVAMVLGDVSGKGLSAALLMGVVQGAVRTASDAGLAAQHEYAAERLNRLVCTKTARERFVSLFWCYLNREGTRLSYINAGHLPALLVRERFGRPDVWRLEQGGGPVLGVLPEARYRQAEVDIEPGDVLVVFSDGISEAANATGAEFGEEGIIESMKRVWREPAAGICDGVLSDVRTFLGEEPPHDDQTLMVVRLERTAIGQDETLKSAAGVGALG